MPAWSWSEEALLAAAGLVAFLAGTLVSADAGFAFGRAVSPLDLAAGGAAGATVVLGFSLARHGRDGLARGALVLAGCAALWFAALRLAPVRYDLSWDGQSYHQQAVIALARGWNPDGAPLATDGFTAHAYADNMAKGAWVLEAAIYRLTGTMEAAKAVNLLWMAAAFLAALAVLLSMRCLPAAAALSGALLAALNPVTFTQLFTFYVDGTVACAFAATAAFAWMAVTRRDRLALLGAGLATVLLANAKLTGVPYAVLLWGAAALAAGVRDGPRQAARVGAAAAVALTVAVLGAGWNPYVTNTLRHGHPFYPAAGPHAQDFVASSRPAAFAAMNRLERLARSTFAVTSNLAWAGARLKLPLTVRWEEGAASAGCDIRLAGFGPLFSGALVLSAAALGLARRRAGLAASLAAGAILATVLVTAEGWWARLAPQLWLVPIVLALAPLSAPARRGARLAGAAALLVLAADAGLVAVNNVNRVGRAQRELRQQLAELAASPGPIDVRFWQFESAGVRLTEAGVPWRPSEELHCAHPELLAGSFRVELCRPETAGR